MEDMVQERPGFFEKLGSLFTRHAEEEEEITETNAPASAPVRSAYRYTVTVRRQISSFDDAMSAANGMKRGEQQVLNLTMTEPVLRQKIVDFMSGVNFAQEGTWEEVGEHIYLIAPGSAYIEVAPPTPRHNAIRN